MYTFLNIGSYFVEETTFHRRLSLQDFSERLGNDISEVTTSPQLIVISVSDGYWICHIN